MAENSYYSLKGGTPDPTTLVTDRAVFKEAYAFIPRRASKDITASLFPGWEKSRGWVLARPLSGFAETFSQTAMEVFPDGGSDQPEENAEAEAVLFVTQGEVEVTIDGQLHLLAPGGFAFIPPSTPWRLWNRGNISACFMWIRKRYQPAPGWDTPTVVVIDEAEVEPTVMENSDGRWKTTRFIDPEDLSHDMHVNIVTFETGGTIPFAETHVMEHGLYVLEGRAVYRLNDDWIEVEAGDFMWLRAFCPQACYEGGPSRFRYLLYKDVNRQMPLELA